MSPDNPSSFYVDEPKDGIDPKTMTYATSAPVHIKTGDMITLSTGTYRVTVGNDTVSNMAFEPGPEPRRIGDMVMIDGKLIPLRKFKDRRFLEKKK